MRTLLWALCGLLLALPARADEHKFLYLRALEGLEAQMPAEIGPAAEKQRLETILEPPLFAYIGLYPSAPLPRIRLRTADLEHGAARSLDTGLILINPYVTVHLSDQTIAGLLAHEMIHIALEHGWARTQLAYDSLTGTPVARLAMAMKGQHSLRGGAAWSALRHDQEFQADNEARRLLAEAGLPAGWVAEAIRDVADIRTTGSHPSASQRLLALATPQ